MCASTLLSPPQQSQPQEKPQLEATLDHHSHCTKRAEELEQHTKYDATKYDAICAATGSSCHRSCSRRRAARYLERVGELFTKQMRDSALSAGGRDSGKTPVCDLAKKRAWTKLLMLGRVLVARPQEALGKGTVSQAQHPQLEHVRAAPTLHQQGASSESSGMTASSWRRLSPGLGRPWRPP
jgi:hypothetical protein